MIPTRKTATAQNMTGETPTDRMMQDSNGGRARRRNLCLATILAAGTMFTPLPGVLTGDAAAQSADQVGVSTRIQNVVSGSAGNRRLAVSDPVFASERISAESNSLGELRLSDNSRIVVGENSSVSLDDFAVAGRGFSDGTIRVAKGALRFITGNSPKGAFNVETPVSTIGVKGTFFDVYVKPNGQTWVVLFRGEVEICSGGNCVTLDKPCDVGKASGPSDVQVEPFLRSGGNSREFEDENFFLSGNQQQISTPNRALVGLCSVRAALQPFQQQQQPPRGTQRQPTINYPDINGRADDPAPDTYCFPSSSSGC